MKLQQLEEMLLLNNKRILNRVKQWVDATKHDNIEVLDNFSIDEDGNILYNGKKIVSNIKISSKERNAIKELEDGIFVFTDPAERVNDQQGIEDCPVGHILSFMGNILPRHYLACDGSEYTISEYPYLAEHILKNFGSYNFFGGNGTITFAVPDLRGEFLRGTGSSEYNYAGSGSDVGEHQAPTLHQYTRIDDGNMYIGGKQNMFESQNMDATSSLEYLMHPGGAYKLNHTGFVSGYTSRPTNTSVMYCIKYEPTYYALMEKEITDAELRQVILETIELLNEKEVK